MLAYCCTNNANRSRVSLGSTFSNCQVLFRYTRIALYTHRCSIGSAITHRACNIMRVINRLSYNQPCWCQLDRNCDQPTSLLMTPRIPPPASIC